MFGNSITDGTQVAIGTYGYVVSFDLTDQDPSQVTQVQLQKSGPLMSAPVTSSTDIATLFANTEASGCPDVAFAQNGNTVFVFLKTSVYAFISTTRIAFWFYRNGVELVDTTSKLDIVPEAKELFKALILRRQAQVSGARVPFDVNNTIDEQKAALGL